MNWKQYQILVRQPVKTAAFACAGPKVGENIPPEVIYNTINVKLIEQEKLPTTHPACLSQPFLS